MAVTLTAVLAFTAMSLVTFETQGGLQENLATKAYYLARRGVTYAGARLGANQAYTGETVTFTEGRCTITVTPDSGNSTSTLKRWTAVCVGTSGTASRTLKAWLISESFSKYVYFSNVEPIGSFWTTGSVFEGPVHTNGHFSFYGVPRFQSRVTTSNSDEYATPARTLYPYDPVAGTYNTRYCYSNPTYGYYAGTQTYTDPSKFYDAVTGNYSNDRPAAYNNSQDFSFAGGQPTKAMPTSLDCISQSTGVIKYLSEDPTRTMTILFNADGTARVTHTSGVVETVSTSPTATIYVVGNVNVSGTVKGKVTLGAMATSSSDTSTGNINITSSLLYSDTTATNHTDTTGLVAWNNVNIVTSAYVRQDVNIFASVMAIKGSYQVPNYSTGIWRGQLALTGGLTVQRAGITGCVDGAGNFVSGYQEIYHYDSRLVDSPPPNFPVVVGSVILRALQDYGALGI